MRTTATKSFLFLPFLGILGCLSVSARAEIKPGSGREQVVAEWGTPSSRMSMGSVEILAFTNGARVKLRGGIVEEFTPPPRKAEPADAARQAPAPANHHASNSAASPTVAAPPVEKSVELGPGIKLELVLIKPGTFQMGSGKNWDTVEEPPHPVTITRPYFLGKHEVTQEQWQALTGENPAGQQKGKKGPETARLPVDNVSWNDIMEKFIPKLQARLPAGMVARLPTEAEWEYACRAGSKTIYCFGDDQALLGDYAWYDANSNWAFHEVGQKKPNAWGLYDMHGNVYECCADWMPHYQSEPQTDPAGDPKGSIKVLRGGSVFVNAGYCRSTFRIGFAPTYRGNFGFRVAVTP